MAYPPPEHPVIRRSLYSTALINYARAFKSGVRRGCTVEQLGLTATERAEHDRLIGLRDKWIAHCVNALDQVVVGVMLSSFNHDAKVLDALWISVRGSSLSPSAIEPLETFIRNVRRRVESENKKAYVKLIARAHATPVTELQRLPEIFVDVPGDDLETVRGRR